MKPFGIFAVGLGVGMVVGWASRWRRDVNLLHSYTQSASQDTLSMRPDRSAFEFDKRLRSYF